MYKKCIRMLCQFGVDSMSFEFFSVFFPLFLSLTRLHCEQLSVACVLQCSGLTLKITNCKSNEYYTVLAAGAGFLMSEKENVCVSARASGMGKEKTRSSCNGLMKQVSLKSATGLNLQH